MRLLTLRSALVAGIAALVLLGAPLESKACEWLWPWNWCRRPVATYAAPACAPCAPQACYYVPQTSYRTTYRYVTTTMCQPVSACNPCTGGAVTAYRPVTAVVLRPALVPYRSYRIVYGQSYAPACAPSCGPCGSYAPSCASGACGISTPSCASGACGVSGVSSAPLSTGSGCSSCAASSVAPSTIVPGPATTAPSLLPGSGPSNGSSAAPPPTYAPSQPAPSTGGGAGGSATAPAPGAGSSTMLRRYWAPNTYTGPVSRPNATGTIPMPKLEPSVKPIPEPSASPASSTAPQLTPPTNNKTASGLIRQAVYVTTPAAPVAPQQSQPAADPYDWHASSN